MLTDPRKRHRAWTAAPSIVLALAVAACGATLRDIDGNEYPTVRLGPQRWMAANLRTTRSPTGAPLPSSAPNDDAASVPLYGRLYDWTTARRACPDGWHLPSDAEWTLLETTLGPHAGGSLKDTRGWSSPELDATNRTGFSARPAGYASGHEFDSQFGTRAVFWSATPADDHFVWSRVLGHDSPDLRRAMQHPQYGFSVRCLED